ncbi:MAG: DUF1476 domain-containing protein [Alphaproteobacteria bacterium]|nr:DUF1476 domain-containing protein [Alphaproteobacteria bacterium]MBV9694520.1 DUF1476 domain-containing protein [Alphaproteobacteria bacterium]
MEDAFKDRERGFERKWAHDEELRFKVLARRDRLVGEWAAGELGLAGAQAKEYAMSVVRADFKHPGHEDVVAKIRADFDAAKLARTDNAIREKMEELLTLAGRQVMAEASR